MNNDKSGGESHITVGDISSSMGVAIGPGAYAAVSSSQLEVKEQIRSQLASFAQKFAFYVDEVEDAQEVEQIAAEALAESARPEPRWRAVRRMLTAVGTSVAGIAALTEAIDNIQQLVSRIIG